MRYLFIFTLSLFSSVAFAQNTWELGEKEASPKAEIEDVAWIAGHWHGLAFGANADEIWTEPEVGTMMGMYRTYDSDSINFYEFMTISEEENSLILRIKHFNRDMVGWEARDRSVEFRLARISADRVYFDGFTFERIGDTEMNIYLKIEDQEGKTEEIRFNYMRVQ